MNFKKFSIILAIVFLTTTITVAQDEKPEAPEVNPDLLDERFIGHWIAQNTANETSFTFNAGGQWKFVFKGDNDTTQTNGGVWHVVEPDLMLWSYETESTMAIPFYFEADDLLVLAVGGREQKLKRITPSAASEKN